ncbi:MAG: N-acetylmuramoyl-L-alanine amidase [Selenomonadaceae bacterium]|nr:N-acetylmuramoyl-L-alanine amidase [Selenomonadaceae bacterium]MBQ7630310.1 N-acetylmuramoyl-L-alanine amidase [Selenomonadaceae bacterium]
MKRFLLLAVAQILIFATIANAAPNIIDKPVLWNDYREQLTLEYAQKHYGIATTTIEPRAVVVHWTAGPTWESAYYTFYDESRGDGTVNVSSQFIVDRDGTIYRTMPETNLARHVIGYNWCAIGIENVGGVGNVEDLTSAQLQANIELIRYLHEKYPSIEYVFGHYQQVAARASGLYIENVPNYYSIKEDPGEIFMSGLRNALEGDGLKFF